MGEQSGGKNAGSSKTSLSENSATSQQAPSPSSGSTGTATPPGEAEIKGWLYKWTNYIKGYQKRWFVLYNGLLSYYRTQAEMSHTCRGTMTMHGVTIITEDSCNFVVSNGATQTWHLRASTEVDRQRWVTALELAKARAIKMLDLDEDEDEELEKMEGDPQLAEDIDFVIRTLGGKLEDMTTCEELIRKHGTSLQRALGELESLHAQASAEGNDAMTVAAKVPSHLKTVSERATLFRITCNAMIKACSDYVDLATNQGRKWQRLLQHERDQRNQFEEMVMALAKQHSHLEESVKVHAMNPGSPFQAPPVTGMAKTNSIILTESESDEGEFFDALEEGHEPKSADLDFIVHQCHKRSYSGQSLPATVSSSSSGEPVSQAGEGNSSSYEMEEGNRENRTRHHKRVEDLSSPSSSPTRRLSSSETHLSSIGGDGDVMSKQPLRFPPTQARPRRNRIPPKPNYSINLWSIMKSSIGKDLTKIPMPVNFNEPLSMLQRLTEEYEYADLLDRAALCSDPHEQMVYVAAFTVSSYASTSLRTGKPFNPLLGETYECDRRDDLGWRAVNEQVSHHPPVASQYCEGRGWHVSQEFSMSSKFRGKYLQIIPLGSTELTIGKSGNRYTWRKVTTTVHNIIVGKLWVDNHGEMTITNHTTGDRCHIKFSPYSYFSRDIPRKVSGYVMDREERVYWVLSGTWDSKMEASRVINTSRSTEHTKPILETAPPRIVWKANPGLDGSEQMYHFSLLAVQLNELEEGVAPTDSRLRPDQRYMEMGQWDEANTEKMRLEEKQRMVRKKRELELERAQAEGQEYPPYAPTWFKKEFDVLLNSSIHKYLGQYWECKEKQDWSRCPNIY